MSQPISGTVSKIPSAVASAERHVLLFGATGTIGQATAQALLEKGFKVTCLIRAPIVQNNVQKPNLLYPFLNGTQIRFGDVSNSTSILNDGFCGERFDVIISCLASRTGTPKDAWKIDYQAQANILECAKKMQVGQMILLSAICVQKPLLAFQQAKLAFEKLLINSGLNYSIVRPTAFFKSLSGQIKRVQSGKSFLLFGDGQLTSCKPISDKDLGEYLVSCIDNSSQHNQILPIGGPGMAITPLQQGEKLFELIGKTPKFSNVPISLMNVIITTLSLLGSIIPGLKDKAELAKIGRYYATESMLVLDPHTGQYDEKLTPSAGTQTLFEFYEELVSSKLDVDLKEHSVF
jgi:divinyl chlorophyllide a 8-vinyl-reductase